MSVDHTPHPPAADAAGPSLSRERERGGARTLPLRKLGATAAVIAGGLLALDIVGLAATVYFGPELVEAAESAGVAHLLNR